MTILKKLACLVERDEVSLFEDVDDPGTLNDRSVLVSFVNPLTIKQSAIRQGFLDELRDLDYVFADGILLSMAISLLNGERVDRLSFDGNSLAPKVFEYVNKRSDFFRCAFVGSEGVTSKAAAGIVSDYYGLEVIRTRDGFFESYDDMISESKKLSELSVNFVVVGMGAPHQERFLLALRESGWNGLAFSCGGYFDQIVSSGSGEYYPVLINKLHLRSIYRMYKEPFRLIPRYVFDYAPFYRDFIRSLIGR